MPANLTLGEMAKALNRPAVYLSGLQRRLELPVLEGAAYSHAYYALLRRVVHLRILNVPEEVLLDLWKTEKHLLQLLHFHTTASSTWYLDQCGKTAHHERRLLLTGHDMGPEFANRMLQPHLDFDPDSSGLFPPREAGEDVLRVLERYHRILNHVLDLAAAETPMLRAALHDWPHIRRKPPPRPADS